jgi:UDP-GlcNAc:undecaprenyl-phosphate GlcNAc-1-phosphate transferase
MPNERSSHIAKTPSFGGIAFYITIVLGMYFLQPIDQEDITMTIIPALLILFIIGLKDDIVILGALTKFIAQVASISFVLIHDGFQFTHLHGFVGIHELSLYSTFPLGAIIMLCIINSFNMIDGIDGLAALTGIIIFSILGLFFFILNIKFFIGMSVIIIGSLLAFLRFNLSKDKKIFMGDTGSLIIGFLIACAVMRILSIPTTILNNLPFSIENLPLVLLSILIVPITDLTRVITIRVFKSRSPFSADRNHIHHILIDNLTLTHKQTSFTIGSFSCLFTALVILLSTVLNSYELFSAMAIIILGLIYLIYRIKFFSQNISRDELEERSEKTIRDNSPINNR